MNLSTFGVVDRHAAYIESLGDLCDVTITVKPLVCNSQDKNIYGELLPKLYNKHMNKVGKAHLSDYLSPTHHSRSA